MIEKILVAFSWIAQIMAEWPKRQADKAQKNYANWRAGYELRKETRARRADLNSSVDKLRPPEGGPK
jgi:hypothetical protein